MMNIAFVANGKKTQFFLQIGKELNCVSGNKFNLFFICCSLKQYDYYLHEGINSDNLLLINWSITNYSNDPIGEYKLNEIIGNDRGMKNCKEKALSYLVNMQQIFYDFVNRNSLRFIFGEMTWAPEILMSRICLDKFKGQCDYLHPQSIRIPNGRFCFMNSEFQDSLYKPSEFFQDKKILDNLQIPIKPAVPQRVADVAKDVKASMSFSRRFRLLMNFLFLNNFKIEKESDAIQSYQLSKWGSRLRTLRCEWNKFSYLHFVKKVKWEDIANKRYLYVTLHMQPEASVDVVGRYYDNQLLNIENLWRILPENYYIVVKEHTNAIGNRGVDFFGKLTKLRNVLIANENIDSYKLLQNAEGVFTCSGTVALESALFGKHSFLFSGIFFDKLRYCHRITLEDLKYSNSFFEMYEKCVKRDSNKLSIEEYSKYILLSSFEGVIDPHQTSPLFEDINNIRTIANSFWSFLKREL